MRGSPHVLLAAAFSLPLLIGCQNQEQSYGAGGAAVGALTCGLIGGAIFHSTAGGLASAAACGAAGYFVGSAIGRKLDEKDRERAQAATQAALAVPVRYTPTQTAVIHPPAKPVTWASDHGTGVTGSSSVVAVQPPAATGGGECRTVREVAYIKGQEEQQDSKYCRGTDGSWVAA
jgi:surface antigen